MAVGKVNVSSNVKSNLNGLSGTLEYNRMWFKTTTGTYPETSSISVDEKGEVLFFQRKKDDLVRINVADGTELSRISHHVDAYFYDNSGSSGNNGGYFLPRKNDGKSIYICAKNLERTIGYVLKYGLDGELIWKLEFPSSKPNENIGGGNEYVANGTYIHYDSKNDVVYALVDRSKVAKVSSGGEVLWEYQDVNAVFNGVCSDSDFVFLKTGTGATKLDADGNVLLSAAISRDSMAVSEKGYDSVYFCVPNGAITEYDKNFNSIRSVAQDGSDYVPARAIYVDGGGLIFWAYSPNGHVMKTINRPAATTLRNDAITIYSEAIGDKLTSDKNGNLYTISRNGITKLSGTII